MLPLFSVSSTELLLLLGLELAEWASMPSLGTQIQSHSVVILLSKHVRFYLFKVWNFGAELLLMLLTHVTESFS